VKIVSAYEIGTISALNVSNVTAIGDIDLISAARNVTNVSTSGNINVVAGKVASKIAGASGTVNAGTWTKISPNLHPEGDRSFFDLWLNQWLSQF